MIYQMILVSLVKYFTETKLFNICFVKYICTWTVSEQIKLCIYLTSFISHNIHSNIHILILILILIPLNRYVIYDNIYIVIKNAILLMYTFIEKINML